jgi:hypothetical protein
MQSEPILRVSEGLVARDFDDETVILDLRTSIYLTSNPTATAIWHVLETGATRSEIVGALLAEFEVTPERAAADVDEFVHDCIRRGYLSVSGDPSGAADGQPPSREG